MTGREEALAAFITDTKWEDVPEDVRERALLCFVDDLAATLSGSTARSTRIAESLALDLLPGDQSTLLGNGGKASMLGAGFANGVAANAYDIDDCGVYTWGHPGAQVFPTVLAAGEKARADGPSALAALVVGYEVMFRAGRCWYDNDPDVYRGCASWGSIGCAAVGARLLGLTPEQTIEALGIAEYHSPSLPLLRAVERPAMVKHGIGLGPLNGLLAAGLALRGFSGTPSLLTREAYDEWVGDLGANYILSYGMSWKEYSCCLWAHAPLLAVEHLRSVHEFDASQVQHILIETYPDALQLHIVHPSTTEEAQFSIAWPVAALLLDGEVTTEQVSDQRTDDPLLHELASKVEFVASDELQRLYVLSETGQPGGMDAARVAIELSDGRVLESGLVEHVVYEREAALWDRVRMEKKFRWLLRDLFSASALDELVDLVWTVQELRDVGEFIAAVERLLHPAGSIERLGAIEETLPEGRG